ncbi:VOC family protein [Microbacterium sp. SD291]|uniref:VOC family protein n=1 Tax=Microbacterium sp. SD291 TaxID=2782007 RepID=UPI001A970A52|nr:VOC family protein [Microbacterium sp. SD291]MBO0982042.1 VOC family protein [Microbacterium sp. SD291]
MANLNPYLSFRTEARKAMEFYQSVLGGDLDINVFGEFPDMVQDPSQKDLVMHAQLTTPDGLVLMASDTPDGMTYETPQGISVSLSGISEETARDVWEKLSAGGTITIPLDTAPWGGLFGMLVDRFGIAWMLSADAEG